MAGDAGNDQRIEAGPPLGGEDRGDDEIIPGIAAQAINRLGGESDPSPDFIGKVKKT